MKKSIFLFFAAILCSVSAWSYNYGGTNVYYYFANTGSWSNVYLYIWNNDNTWNTDFTLNKIANTNVYYHKWSSAYNNNGGILFRASTENWTNKTSDIKANYTSHTSWVHNSTTGKTDLSNINRQAKVVAMLSTGGDYTATANANCTATVSGYTVEKGKSTATSKSASTSGSANNASISAAYGSTITYTATAGTGYTFKGFSTSNSTSLPASLSASGKTATANKYGTTNNNTTYYAYFKANQYTVKFDANGGTGSMSDQSHTYSVSQALTANAFTRTGYTFEGWNTQADGTGTSYTDKQSVSNLSSTDGGSVTLYAQWAEIPANNHNITYTVQATGWTYGAQPASAAEGATVTFEVIPTTGYTVTVTSSDVSLSKNDNTYTFTMPTTDVAIDVTATENMHDVTISYKCGDQTIQANGTATAVGEITAKEITAPEITGYKFTSWTLGNGITNKSANNTTNPINITTKASGTYTLTANYEKVVTIYFVNSSKWDAVACYHWPDGGSGSWPGDKLTTTGETVNEFDVYKATFTAQHDKCIFNNNDKGSQTGDLDVQDGKYYYPLKNQWYDSLNDIPAIDPLATNVYLVGGMNSWSTDANEFRKAEKDDATASVVMNLTAATTYEFKVIRDGAWTSYNGTITKDASGLQFSNSTNDNAKIITTVAGDYTFTWTISSSKLAVTYPTICAITATANDAAMGTIAGAGEYGKGSTATLTATPNDGYLFVNWTKGSEEVSTDATYSFKVEEAVELVANFKAAPEEVHNVTVSYVCGGNKIAEDQTVAAVGVTTPKTAEAPAIFGYTFESWTLGADVTTDDALTSNAIDINIVAGGSDFTLTANYTEIPKVTIYVVNNTKWDKVYAYGWGGSVGENPAWPGTEITTNKESEKIVGFDVYSYSVVPGSYVNIKFTNGLGAESANFKWTDGKYYYMDAANDYVGGTKEEVTKELTPTYTVAGDNRIVFGEEWAPAKVDNDMVDQGDGTYTWTKSEIALKKNTQIKFKVVKNHDWGKGSWPGEDWVINTISKDGYYTITIIFKESDKSITATATWTGEAPFKDFSNQPATLYFHPSFHWTSDNAEFAAYFYNEGFGADTEPKWADMTDSDGDGVYEVANAKQHEYVIICRMNPSRTENKWDDAVSWNKIETGITIPNTAGDLNTCIAFWKNCQGNVPTSECTWVAPTPLTDKNWDAFIAAYNGKTINAVVERSFKPSQNHTLCLPFNLPTNWLGEGAKAYQLSRIVSNSTAELELMATECATLYAGKPYIVVPVKGSEYEHLIVSGVRVEDVDAGTNVATGAGYKATLKAVTATDGTQTNGSTEYYVGANDGYLYNAVVGKLGLRAIIELTTTSGQPLPAKVRAYVAAEENEATGFENIVAPEGQTIKAIVNGQLVIIRGGEMYNIQGQKL